MVRDIEITLEGNIEGFILGERRESIGQLDGTSGFCGGSMFGYASLMSGKKPALEKTVRWIIKAVPGEVLSINIESRRAGNVSRMVTIPN